jgi:hypothetical protein
MAAVPAYAATPKIGAGTVTTADTSRTAPTTVVTVFTAGANGSRIDRINLEAIGTTTATTVRLFLYNGTTYYLWQELPVSAVTPSGTVQAFNSAISSAQNPNNFPLPLPSGWSLRASINDTQASSGVNVIALGGDL